MLFYKFNGKQKGLVALLLFSSLTSCAHKFFEEKESETKDSSKLSEPSLCSDKKGRELLKRARERERLLIDFGKVKSPTAEMSIYAETLLKKKWKKENHDDLSRAFLIMGLSKLRLQKAGLSTSGSNPSAGNAQVLDNAQTPANGPSLSLEDELAEKSVDLLLEIRQNPFLQSSEIYDIILRSIQKDSATLRESSAQSLHSILLERLADWQNLESSYQVFFNPSLPATEFPTPGSIPSQEAPTAASPAQNAAVIPLATALPTAPVPTSAAPTSPASSDPLTEKPAANSADAAKNAAQVPTPTGKSESGPVAASSVAAVPAPSSNSEILERVQKLMEQNKFLEALTALKGISPDYERYAEVQTKIKDVCNRAVHELRTKAAKAFQSAMPVTDSQVRRKYLLEAQKYLDTAIASFGEAEQIQVVRENLNIVNKNLENLK